MGVREDMVPPSNDSDELKVIRENYHNGEIFNMNEMVEIMGRRLMPGDVLELPHLRDQLLLNANKNAIVLVQDEGEDVVIENLDFASVADNVNTRMLVTAMNHDQDVSGTQKQVLDTDHDSGNSDSIRFAGQVKFHSSQTFTIVVGKPPPKGEPPPPPVVLNKKTIEKICYEGKFCVYCQALFQFYIHLV
mgnify:CR=1 FL=1